MKQQELLKQLSEKHLDFHSLVSNLKQQEFEFQVGEKWSAAQQFDHIIKSVDALLLVFKLPRFVPKLLFGKANRPSRTYEQVVEKYHKALESGGKAGKAFTPPVIPFSRQSELLSKYKKVTNSLCSGVSKMSETELDLLVIPHPLLGKMTLREMLYFTLYHVQHHHQSVASQLQK